MKQGRPKKYRNCMTISLSFDLLPTEILGQHYQGDVRDILYQDWDMIIAHPDCTPRCNSGVRWIINNLERQEWLKREDEFFMQILNSKCKRICIENPIPHKYSKVPKYTQIIQPWQFGHGETKATCLWLKGLPKLEPTNIVSGREQRIWRMPPSKNRGKERSRTFQGIAQAMADQWG